MSARGDPFVPIRGSRFGCCTHLFPNADVSPLSLSIKQYEAISSFPCGYNHSPRKLHSNEIVPTNSRFGKATGI